MFLISTLGVDFFLIFRAVSEWGLCYDSDGLTLNLGRLEWPAPLNLIQSL